MTYKNIFLEGSISPTKIANSITAHQSKTNIGAHSIFLGQVRADQTENGTIQAIEYTAYQDMALELAHGIREEIFLKYELTCMHIYHSLGVVPAGEICLFVFTSSKRRKAAIEACSELVERIKSELPIWGKEIIDNENSQWKINA
jgi:molybdopterin synthase catalytic subunit